MSHEPLCMDHPDTPDDLRNADCDCELIKRVRYQAYREGYNARARSAATTYAMYGIPERAVEHGAGENP